MLSATGGAVAGGLITSKLIKNDTIKTVDVKDGTLKAADISSAGKAALRGNAGPAGATGATGATGAQGLPGSARAYGTVRETGALSRSFGVEAITQPSPGVTCIDLVNSITVSTASLIPSPEFTFDSTQVFNTSGDDNTLVEWNSAAAQCPAGTMQVTTALQRFSAGALIGNELQPQAFVFVVP